MERVPPSQKPEFTSLARRQRRRDLWQHDVPSEGTQPPPVADRRSKTSPARREKASLLEALDIEHGGLPPTACDPASADSAYYGADIDAS